MPAREIIEADLTWTAGGRFERGVRIAVEAGMISEVGRMDGEPTRRLADRALLSGFINAHSHAFQRGLRGRGERFPAGAGSFWTWREAMYQLVESMDEKNLYSLSRQAFTEMLAAGITTVGEFHYLHHDSSCQGFQFDEVVLRAAADAGIRIVLIQTYYETGGIDRPLAGGQLRFQTDSLDEFWRQADRLATLLDRRTQSLAIAGHSIRAVPVEVLQELHEETMRRAMPFHMHVEEQPLEIADCVHAYGKTPLALVNERLSVSPLFTAIHCTHSAGADMNDFRAAGGNVCLCPLTEGNLGDGVPMLPRMLKSGGAIALGSDSNARLDFIEEMRWLEYVQRVSLQRRGVVVDDAGYVAARLLEAVTVGGARALGVKAGRIEPGRHADFCTIDLTAPALEGWTEETLLDSIIFGAGSAVIGETCVGGTWVRGSIPTGRRRPADAPTPSRDATIRP